jgi:hypothetical protein
MQLGGSLIRAKILGAVKVLHTEDFVSNVVLSYKVAQKLLVDTGTIDDLRIHLLSDLRVTYR